MGWRTLRAGVLAVFLAGVSSAALHRLAHTAGQPCNPGSGFACAGCEMPGHPHRRPPADNATTCRTCHSLTILLSEGKYPPALAELSRRVESGFDLPAGPRVKRTPSRSRAPPLT